MYACLALSVDDKKSGFFPELLCRKMTSNLRWTQSSSNNLASAILRYSSAKSFATDSKSKPSWEMGVISRNCPLVSESPGYIASLKSQCSHTSVRWWRGYKMCTITTQGLITLTSLMQKTIGFETCSGLIHNEYYVSIASMKIVSGSPRNVTFECFDQGCVGLWMWMLLPFVLVSKRRYQLQ